ncbi:MAG TPA: DUF4142 domain-containing protein [Stellaceae bacterium]|nr:DUF4142 domain-containing protein [Stellaceae bacterium]
MNTMIQGAALALGVLASSTAFGQTAATPRAPAHPAPAMSTSAATSTGRLNDADQKFVSDAAIGGMFEVESGKLAEKSTNAKVREFGARMVRDHSTADNKLKQIVAQQGGTVPNSLDQEHQQKLDQLASLKGQDFDRQYAQMMVQDHDTDAQDFGKAAQNLTDPQLKQFAAQTLKVIESHDKLAHQMANQMAVK